MLTSSASQAWHLLQRRRHALKVRCADEAMNLFRKPAAATFPVRGEGFCRDDRHRHFDECESPHPAITTDEGFAWCLRNLSLSLIVSLNVFSVTQTSQLLNR